jgi:LysM repeat protein
VRFGDTFAAIAASHGTTERRLHQINGFEQAGNLRAGTVLLVPQRATSDVGSPQDDVVTVPNRRFKYANRKRVFYRVRSDDTVPAVAAAFGVTQTGVLAWNALDESARLQSGMVLQLYVKSNTPLDRVRYLTERETRVLVAGTPEFFDYFEGLKGKKRILVTARKGDTLRSIGKRYGMSVGWMERVNRRSRRDQLRPGETVVVYAPRSAASPGSVYSEGPAVSPLPAVEPPLPRALPATPGTRFHSFHCQQHPAGQLCARLQHLQAHVFDSARAQIEGVVGIRHRLHAEELLARWDEDYGVLEGAFSAHAESESPPGPLDQGVPVPSTEAVVELHIAQRSSVCEVPPRGDLHARHRDCVIRAEPHVARGDR